MIYLACPYWHNDERVRQERFRAANIVAGKLMEQGHFVYSPISHSVPIEAQFSEKKPHEFWMQQDIEILRHCEWLFVLMLPGWEESKGVSEEIKIANAIALDVTYLNPENFGL